jgi:hypothetical protein
MRRRLEELSENATALGQAGLELARAEAAALSGELKISGRALLKIVLLFVSCLFFFFWAVAVLVYVGIEVGAIWLPRWGSGLAVFGTLLLIVLIIGAVARQRLSRLETPIVTARRRLADHLGWWRERVLGREN